MDNEKNKRIYAQIVAKAWANDGFKAEFLKSPTKTATDFGMELLPNTVVVVVHEGHVFTADTKCSPPKLTVALPPRPDDLVEHALLKISTNAFITSKSSMSDV